MHPPHSDLWTLNPAPSRTAESLTGASRRLEQLQCIWSGCEQWNTLHLRNGDAPRPLDLITWRASTSAHHHVYFRKRVYFRGVRAHSFRGSTLPECVGSWALSKCNGGVPSWYLPVIYMCVYIYISQKMALVYEGLRPATALHLPQMRITYGAWALSQCQAVLTSWWIMMVRLVC